MADNPQRPKSRRKCHARAVNVPGWLEVTTYVTCMGGRCVVDGSGEEHRVIVKSDSPLPYFVTVRGICTTDGVAYDEPSGPAKEWTPNPVHLAGRHRGPAVAEEIGQDLVVVEARENETLEVAVSWDCVTFDGTGLLTDPLILQIDTRAAGGS
ncbi:hypothetical protein AB0M02_45075 [Actinoplanes sp. NPDC051861]|uniref:hypothetical protein n=1 Tax=Actinoplanes sp. NPDC051861 TaxID=3155170 RepID=UPI003438CF0B